MTFFISLILAANLFAFPALQINAVDQETRFSRRVIPEADPYEEYETTPPTPEEAEKLRLACEAATRFVQRWHETLDLEVVMDEMLVSDPALRRLGMAYIGGVMDQEPEKPPEDQGEQETAAAAMFDESLEQKVFVSGLNWLYLRQEYSLAFEAPEARDDPIAPELDPEAEQAEEHINRSELPPEIQEAEDDFEKTVEALEATRHLSSEHLGAILGRLSHLSSLYRKYLPPDAFSTQTYQDNLKRLDADSPVAEVIYSQHGFLPLPDNTPVYGISLGGFHLLLIEEEGQFKVFTLVISRC